VPFAETPIPDPDFDDSKGLKDDEGNPTENSDEPFYKQAPRGLPGLAGESRIHDANTPMFRVQVSAGSQTIVETGPGGEELFGQTAFTPNGTRPAMPERRPVYRPGIACENQEPPNMRAPKGGRPTVEIFDAKNPDEEDRKRLEPLGRDLNTLMDHLARRRQGKPSVDPFEFQGKFLDKKLKELGLERDEKGHIVERKELDR
jgi:hypothetical protein